MSLETLITKKNKNLPKNINVDYSKRNYHQFSYSKYDNVDYENYNGFPVLNNYNCYLSNNLNNYKIITGNILCDTPVDDNILDVLKNSVKIILNKIKIDFPVSFGYLNDLDVIIQYNNYGSTFLEWKFNFDPKKFKKFLKKFKVSEIYDSILSLNFFEYDELIETIYDIEVINGEILNEVVDSNDDEEIKYQFERLIKLESLFGYELNDREHYKEQYGIKIEIIDEVLKNYNSK